MMGEKYSVKLDQLPYGTREFALGHPGLAAVIQTVPEGLRSQLEQVSTLNHGILVINSDPHQIVPIEIAEAYPGIGVSVLNFVSLERTQRARYVEKFLGRVHTLTPDDLELIDGSEVQYPLAVMSSVNVFRFDPWRVLKELSPNFPEHGQFFAHEVLLERDRGPRELSDYFRPYGVGLTVTHSSTPAWLGQQGYQCYGLRIKAGPNGLVFPESQTVKVSGPDNNPLSLTLPLLT